MSIVVSGLGDRANSDIVFVDQFKMVCRQTPTKGWLTKDADMLFDARPDNLTLTACVACSVDKFLGAMYFLRELTSHDFVHFLCELSFRLSLKKRWRILLDNAPWHSANLVKSSIFSSLLIFNIPGLYQLNFIEESFGKVRHRFRSRKVVDSLREEVEQMNQILFDQGQKSAFDGYKRYYIRTLASLAKTVESLKEEEEIFVD